jgi:DNA-binding SARP family transcriptional activator/predicted ATPase
MWRFTLFGAPTLERNGRFQPLTRRKARALLTYLAVTQQAHSRETIVALLWPDYDQQQGRADLSRILSNLRVVLGADCILADRQQIALHDKAPLWVDVVHFRQQLGTCREIAIGELDEDCRQKLETVVDYYQADFLSGFTLPDCPTFDEWQFLQTEALRRDLSWALEKLVYALEAQSNLVQAIVYAQRWVALDPLHEPAQRRLIALYGRNGQRAEAHRQYQTCERLLAEELGIEPEPETIQLYDQIRQGDSNQPVLAKIPRFDWPEPAPQSLFVARTQELAGLNTYLDEALNGNGRVAFITGGAGRGKTLLLAEFARRAQEAHKDLIVAGGSGSAVAGVGDPYLPFREVIESLTGNVTIRRASGAAGVEQARRLWVLLPETAQAILEHGPQLLDLFVSAKQLLTQAAAAAPAGAHWLAALREEVARRNLSPGALEQTAVFGQVTSVLHHLAQKRPLLIILDDLQWIDAASSGLLFHLGRRLAGSRILIVGAYRPDELSHGQPPALVQLLDEFKRTYGDVFIDLTLADKAEGMAFVDAFLDSEPNRLDAAFRQALFQRTGGHPLFVVELLRDMQSRGALVQDEAGQWREGQALDWQTLPARVEAVIAQRVERLDDDLRAVLEAASVEGELFTAEVVAQVMGMAERPLLRSLSQELGKQQRLVRERGELKVGQRYLSAYQFSHALFQQYLYHQLSPGERRRLHGSVAAVLGELYAEDIDQVVNQLAYHYTVVADWPQATHYHSRAGELAYQKASLLDALHHYQAALAHWPQSNTTGQAKLLSKLGECLWILGQHQEAIEMLQTSCNLFEEVGDNQGIATAQRLLGRVYWEAGQLDKAGRCYRQALDVLEGEPEGEALAWALASMSNYHMHLGNYEESINLGEQALALARHLSANALIIQCLCDLGSAISSKGDWTGVTLEQESLELALASNRPHDAGRAYLYIAEALIYLGRYEQARELLQEAIFYTQRMHIPYIAEGASHKLAELDQLTGRWSAALNQLQTKLEPPDSGEPASLSQLYLNLLLGRIYNDMGLVEQAHKLLTAALAGPVKSLDPRVALLGELARAEAYRGRQEAALAATREILKCTGQALYLFPNMSLALLFVCRLPMMFSLPKMVRIAQSAYQQLERLDRQFSTLTTAACLLEGKGWVALSELDATEAAAAFKQAVTRWQELGHPFDQSRTLSGLGQALAQMGDRNGVHLTLAQADELINVLAAQLDDHELKSAFLDSPLVKEIHAAFR